MDIVNLHIVFDIAEDVAVDFLFSSFLFRYFFAHIIEICR